MKKRMFLASVEKTDSCWLWRGGLDCDGYGQTRWQGKTARAHRVSYQLFCGPIPEGLVIRHSCDTPACVNPDHLIPGTLRDNAQDIILRNRRSGHSKVRRPNGWMFRRDARRQFLRTVRRGRDGRCWTWLGLRDRQGYGHLSVNNKPTTAHRVAYQLWIGPIPEDRHVLHSCDNPSCVNPNHLRLGTHAENMAEAVQRQRHHYGDDHWTHQRPERIARGETHRSRTHPESVASGEEHWTHRNPDLARQHAKATIAKAKYTDQQILRIRALAAEDVRIADISRQVHMRAETVRRIVYGLRRPDLPGALPYEHSDVHWAKRNRALAAAQMAANFRKYTDEQVQQVRSLAAQGMPMTEIAERMGMHKDTVRKFILGILRPDLPGALVRVGRGKFAVVH